MLNISELSVITREDVCSLPSITHCLRTLVIEEGACNDMTSALEITHFSQLTLLQVKKNSFKKVPSLHIDDCPLLEKIHVENGERIDFINNTCYGAFESVHELMLTSLNFIL